MSKAKEMFFVEVTDTYGGEANYSWVKRYKVAATTFRGAVTKVAKESGLSFRKDYDTGDMARYNAQGACICLFVSALDNEEEQYSSLIEI
jgi:hypothetical protein